MEREDYFWIVSGIYGVVMLVYHIFTQTFGPTTHWWLIGVGVIGGLFVGTTPWWILSNFRPWKNAGILFSLFFAGLLALVFSSVFLSPASTFFSSVYIITNSVGAEYWRHRRHLNQRAKHLQ